MQTNEVNTTGLASESLAEQNQAEMGTPAQDTQKVQEHLPITPIANNERIEVLDVIRGFALIGIFLMNIEFFNRSTHELGEGIPHGLTGLNWLAAFCIQYFVTGKFWTMFSMLFGMGFAVMLTRAQAKGSEFLKPYIRRVAALAVFGIMHTIFLWPGDILLSYAATASMLLLILFAPAWVYVLGMALFGLVAVIPGMDNFASIAVLFALAGWVALYIRNDQGIVHGIYAVAASFSLLIAIGMAVFSEQKTYALIAFLIAVFGFVLSYVLMRFHRKPEQRPLAFGVIYYLSIFLIAVAAAAFQYVLVDQTNTATAQTSLHSQNNEEEQTEEQKDDQTQAVDTQAFIEEPNEEVAGLEEASATSPVMSAQEVEDDNEEKKRAEKKRAEKEKNKEQERIEARAEQDRKSAKEIRIIRSNSYVDLMKLRAHELAEGFGGNIFMSCLAIAMFLIGFGLMRLGIMENTKAYLPQFKKMALIGIPLGLSIDLSSAYFAIEYYPGQNEEAFGLALTMQMLSYLPTCLGYVALLVCLMHTRCASFLRNLAPYGRMALTNYLGQSLIASTVFYGYGLGWFGMERAKQVLFVFVIVALQIAFSHWWLARFRYGPMEWIWRAITYWTWPKNWVGRS